MFSFLTFIKVLFLFTENNIEDKEIPSFYLLILFLNNDCRNNKNITKEAIYLCKLFWNNEFINKDIKNQINIYLNETK